MTAAAAADVDPDVDDDCSARSGVVRYTSSPSTWSRVTSCGCSARDSIFTLSSYEHSSPTKSFLSPATSSAGVNRLSFAYLLYLLAS